ncbi:MAG: hypothetical protein J5I47_03475 [Vicingus serpentipes]|nr:hypothetical protein [Vicingus serpentipes]
MIFSDFFSQEKSLGINIGYGSTKFKEARGNINLENPFNDNRYSSLELIYYHKPKKTSFMIKSGLIYDKRKNIKEDYSLSYLRVPAGLDFVLGNKLKLVLGGGVNIGYVIANKGIEKNVDLKKFQIGGEINLGFTFGLSDKISLLSSYQSNFDFLKIYKIESSSPSGAIFYEKIKGTDGFIKVGLTYTFLNN